MIFGSVLENMIKAMQWLLIYTVACYYLFMCKPGFYDYTK